MADVRLQRAVSIRGCSHIGIERDVFFSLSPFTARLDPHSANSSRKQLYSTPVYSATLWGRSLMGVGDGAHGLEHHAKVSRSCGTVECESRSDGKIHNVRWSVCASGRCWTWEAVMDKRSLVDCALLSGDVSVVVTA